MYKVELSVDDRHAADPAWALEDIKGHGTQMAGLALYGDLTSKLHDGSAVEIHYRLESVKLLPDAGENPHHLLGAVTRNAINVVEQNHPRRRTFTMCGATLPVGMRDIKGGYDDDSFVHAISGPKVPVPQWDPKLPDVRRSL